MKAVSLREGRQTCLWVHEQWGVGPCVTLPGLSPQLQTGRLKQQKLIFSQFWRLEVQGQGVGKVGFFRGLSPWLIDGHLLPVSSPGLPSVHLCVLNYKDMTQKGWGPTHMTSFNLITSLEAPSLIIVTFWGPGFEAAPHEFGGHNLSHNSPLSVILGFSFWTKWTYRDLGSSISWF